MTLLQYCTDHSSQQDAALYEVYRSVMLHTANPNMASTPEQSHLLEMLAALTQPTVAVEIGSYAGYGAVCIARGLPTQATLHVVEVEEEYEDLIRHHAQMAGVAEQIQIHIGQALNLIPTLPDNIGFAFVDADKEHYADYYDLLIPKMRPNALLIFDNMLWYGRVLETVSPHSNNRIDRETVILQNLAQRITADPRVDNLLLPLRDGLMLCRTK